jgi:hypothetical protein
MMEERRQKTEQKRGKAGEKKEKTKERQVAPVRGTPA